jgi:hypothetical protein
VSQADRFPGGRLRDRNSAHPVSLDRTGDTGADYHLIMSRCTAPVQGHRTASGAAACPACSGRRYGYYSPPRPYYPSSGYTPRSGSGGSTSSGGGSVGGRTRPRWSPSSSTVTYTPDEVRALTPYRRTVELRGQQPELRDLFLCHAWDDRRSVATELNDLLETKGVSVWFSEKDILLGQPFMREIDRGLAKSRAGLVLITPALLQRVNNRGVSDKELSELLARDQLIPTKRSARSAPCSAPDTGWTRRKIRWKSLPPRSPSWSPSMTSW